MKVFFDQLNRKLELSAAPGRIVSLVPSQTELLCDLGLEEAIVGVTKFCVHPPDLRKKKEVIGGTKQVKFDRVRQLAPDIILANKEENTPEIVRELEKVAPVHVSDIASIDDTIELIREYGEMFNTQQKASEIAAQILDNRADFVRGIAGKPVRKVAYFIWKDPFMVAGKDTFVDHLLRLNNFENIFGGEKSRYPEVKLKQVKERNTDLVLLSTEPYPFKGSDKEIFSNVVREDCVHIVDGEYFSWYGSRLIAAFSYFTRLHQELSFS